MLCWIMQICGKIFFSSSCACCWRLVRECFVFLFAFGLLLAAVEFGRIFRARREEFARIGRHDGAIQSSRQRSHQDVPSSSSSKGNGNRFRHQDFGAFDAGRMQIESPGEKFQIGDESIGFVDLPTPAPFGSICDNDTEVLIFVLTTPENRFFRRQLRRVWANKCNLGLHKFASVMLMGLHPHLAQLTKKLNESAGAVHGRRASLPNSVADYTRRLRVTYRGFVLNASIVRENAENGDIVMIDYPESYQNLTYKVAAGFQWAHKYCPQATLVGKVDDDVYLSVDRLVRYLQGYAKKGVKRVIGAHNQVYSPARWNASRWYVNYNDYPRKVYPPYANGFTYFLTQEYIEAMMSYLKGRKLLPVEDVFLTGIVADAIGADRVYSFLDWTGNCTFAGDCSFLGNWLNTTGSSYATAPISVLCFNTNYDEFARQKLALERLQRFAQRTGLRGWPFE